MNAETNLQTLLRNMSPKLHADEFVYCTLDAATVSELALSPIGQFVEEEGVTVILRRKEAEANELNFSYPCQQITLNIHSSLDAVGFLAVITEKLARRQSVPT